MKVVVIIPARYDSTRFEGKPLALIAGKPMIEWVYGRAKMADSISDVVVATDDDRIFDAANGKQWKLPPVFGSIGITKSPPLDDGC